MDRITITSNDRVFVLTGAGISAESGLATFRASDGLWAGHRIEDVCTPEALENNPWLVWKFYSERRASCARVQPNPAHIALAELESKLGDRFLTLASPKISHAELLEEPRFLFRLELPSNENDHLV